MISRSPIGEPVLNEIQSRCLHRNRDTVIVLVLTVLAFAVRFYRVDFNSFSEDESAKWAAVQQYEHGHFAGVNSEHPMLLKMSAWASLKAGECWNRIALRHGWPSLLPEGWLRLPNVLFGALATAVLYLLCRRMMRIAGSFAASLFWAVSPLAIALNRLAKEETPLTFFTLLACYFYCRAQQAEVDVSARRWYDLSAISFGLSFASQYIIHLLGLNALAWLIAGKMGITREPSRFRYTRFFLIIFISLIFVNPVVLSPSNFHAIVSWLHQDGVKHIGYDFDGTLYINLPARLLTGVPWFYYLWLLLVKTPIPILAAVIVGSIMLLRDRRTIAFCFFMALGMIQLLGLSVSGAKWIRYSLPLLPFLYLAGGYAVQQTWNFAKARGRSLAWVTAAAAILLVWPLVELRAWTPYYPFYLNAIGGGRARIARYFAPDEVSEFDSREVAQVVCASAPMAATLATARPMSMAYYLETCGRTDIHIKPLYNSRYAPSNGDLIVLEASRRFFETQKFFDTLPDSPMSHREVHVGPVVASTIYRFDGSVAMPTAEQATVTQLRKSGSQFPTSTRRMEPAMTNSLFAFLPGRARSKQ